MDFVALDVETANRHHQICQIGAVLVKNGAIVDRFETLVNPIVPFESENIKKHQIRAKDVLNAPIFPELLKKAPEWLFQYPIIAHNAQVEYHALAVSFQIYKLPFPNLVFYCTYETAARQKKMPRGLKELASYLNIPFENHHNALSDAECAASIALKFMASGIMLNRYVPDPTRSLLIDKNWENFHPIGGKQFFPDPQRMWIKPGTRAAESYLMHNDCPELITYNTDFYRIPDCEYWQGDIDFQGKTFVISGLFPPYILDVLWVEIYLRGGFPTDKFSLNADYVVVGAAKVAGEGSVKSVDGKSSKIIEAEAAINFGLPIKMLQGKQFLNLLGK